MWTIPMKSEIFSWEKAKKQKFAQIPFESKEKQII